MFKKIYNLIFKKYSFISFFIFVVLALNFPNNSFIKIMASILLIIFIINFFRMIDNKLNSNDNDE